MSSLKTRAPEFPEGASEWPEGLDRRQFLEVMGASAALAGLAGCRPAKTLVPYVAQPESVVPGVPVFYATAMPVEGFGRGILVESHQGRPTKIEGNPAHSESQGAADAITQAAILGLYDPDRSQAPLRNGFPAAWGEFDSEWRARVLPGRGEGLALLTEPTTSPTVLGQIHALLDRFPQARWHQHTPLCRYDEDGVQADLRPEEAEIIFSIGSDFLAGHPASLRYARAFSRRRRSGEQCRLYVMEAAWSPTGTMADHRLAISPLEMPRILTALAAAMAERNEKLTLSATSESDQGGGSRERFVARLARDLRDHAPRVLIVAGADQTPEIRRWALACNRLLGSLGRTVLHLPAIRSDSDPRCAGDLAALAAAIDGGAVRTLAVLGANPVYTAPGGLDFGAKLASVEFAVHAGSHRDETARRCRWHLPEAHFLETWSDLRGFDGSVMIQQPLIEPLYPARSAAEILATLRGEPAPSGYEMVRSSENSEKAWAENLRRGVSGGPAAAVQAPSALTELPRLAQGNVIQGMTSPSGGLGDVTLVFLPDPALADGRWANNGWLQELPRPVTSLVWDNALQLSPATAVAAGLGQDDVVAVEAGGGRVEAAVAIVPGQADGCAVAFFGGGRWAAGKVGAGRGFDGYRLRPGNGAWTAANARLGRTGRSYRLASTQHQFTMEGRDTAKWVKRGLAASASETSTSGPTPSLYPDWGRRDAYAWGMTIDLTSCFGCGACVTACQAENNSPVVGREMVLRGREMHWIRIDRYHAEAAGEARLFSQPVPCMQCEDAPCELVCPVGATVHSSEGLNEMVYNRCVGTRYCSNNCPYKVRRFNFFDYRAAADSIVHLADNPEVTVRQRGVMEKCTYCVQRIDRARSTAEREGRRIRDGEIRTACQQACPAEAIVFGDIADAASAVAGRKRDRRNYAMLAELNTRPRTTYLAREIDSA